MILFLAGAALLQIHVSTGPKPCPEKRGAPKDTACVGVTAISVGGIGTGARKGPPRRQPVTAQHLATAFRDPSARGLLLRARAARMRQDSALQGYDATGRQRVSLGVAVSRLGRERLLFRAENVARVRWRRGRGAYVEAEGARAAAPMAPEEAESEIEGAALSAPIPYYPGQEELWVGMGTVRGEVDERDAIHPLAEGAEAYYTYASGDSTVLRLPDGTAVRVRELVFRPRGTRWNLAVGSLWLDADRGTLVRAAFRFAEPLDFWHDLPGIDSVAARSLKQDLPRWARGLASPIRGQIRAIALEYGLHEGRFWLPRTRYAEGDVQVSFARFPYRIEQSYRYAAVNAADTIPTIGPPDVPSLDSLSAEARKRWRDSVQALGRARRDSVRRGLIARERAPSAQCDTSETYVRTFRAYEGQLPVAVRVPCDRRKLATSPELTGSIYDDEVDAFGPREREELVAQAVGLGAQPAWGPQPPRLAFGPRLWRYNRVEGLSLAGAVDQELGAGYDARFLARLGTADLEPNVELSLRRTDLRRTVRLMGYNRLTPVSEHGNPFSFGASLGAAIFGSDDAYYYRASGLELAGVREPLASGARVEWRVFAEQQRNADVETEAALFGDMDDPNVVTPRSANLGASLRALRALGADPRRTRLFSDLRLEGAGVGEQGSGTSGYGRAALDVTAVRPFGPLAGALTLGGGYSLGDLPAQRGFYLGGAHTVRGQRFGAAGGDAYWLGRGELGTALPLVRPVVFADIGWAGDRTHLGDVGRPLSGAGIGGSFVDGLLRLDVAKGIYPEKKVRVSVYMEAKF